MRRHYSRRNAAVSTIAVIAICAVLLTGVVLNKSRAYDCYCSVGAAFVALTGSTITSYTLVLVDELYLVLWEGFAAINTQINGTTNSYEETGSYQTQVIANVEREKLAAQAVKDNLRAPTIGFQTSASSGAGGAELNTDLARDAILDENYEWQVNMAVGTSGGPENNAAYSFNRHQEKYCNLRESELGLCDLPEDHRLISADINAGVIEQETLDDKLVGAAIDRCRNLVGLPPPPGNTAQYNSPQGAVERSARTTANARDLMAYAMCDYLVAMRTELPEDSLRAWAEQVVKRITGGVGLPPPAGSCGSVGGGFTYIPTNCSLFSTSTRYNGHNLTAEQANNMNVIYSYLVSNGVTHEVAIAVAFNVGFESGGGTNLRECRNQSSVVYPTPATGSCCANLSGKTSCLTTGPGRQTTIDGHTGYAPTGLGIIQWSGWKEDGGWGEGAVLQNADPTFQKCSLITSDKGGCGGSKEQTLQNNTHALLLNIQGNGSLSNKARTITDINSATNFTVNQWIRPADTYRPVRMSAIPAAYNDPANGLQDSTGACTQDVSDTADDAEEDPPVVVHEEEDDADTGDTDTADTGSSEITGGTCGATADLGLNIEAEHISHLELMKLVSEYRFQDPGWAEFVNSSAGHGQLVRELAAIGAIRQYLGWQTYERQQQTAAVVAAWAAAEADRAYRTKIK